MSTIVSRLPLNILEAVRDREAWFQRTTTSRKWGNGLWEIQYVTDDVTLVTLKGQTRDPNTLRAQYLENSWTCCL